MINTIELVTSPAMYITYQVVLVLHVASYVICYVLNDLDKLNDQQPAITNWLKN